MTKLKLTKREDDVIYEDEIVEISTPVTLEDCNGELVFERRVGGNFSGKALWVNNLYEAVIGLDSAEQQIIVFRRRR